MDPPGPPRAIPSAGGTLPFEQVNAPRPSPGAIRGEGIGVILALPRTMGRPAVPGNDSWDLGDI